MIKRFIGAFLLLSVVIGKVNAEIVVDIEGEKQVINYWGIKTYNNPEWDIGGTFDITSRDGSMSALYSDLGANIVRFRIPSDVLKKDKKLDTLRNAIKQMELKNPEMSWYAVPWGPPVEYKQIIVPPLSREIDIPNGSVNGVIWYEKKKYNSHLKSDSEEHVAQWLFDVVNKLVYKEDGTRLIKAPVAIGIQNEPDWSPAGYEGCLYTPVQLLLTAKILREKLDGSNKSNLKKIKITVNDGGSEASPVKSHPQLGDLPGTVNMLELDSSNVMDSVLAHELDLKLGIVNKRDLGVISTHTYDVHNDLDQGFIGGTPLLQYYSDLIKKYTSQGYEHWMTEWEVRHEHANTRADIAREMMYHFNRDMSIFDFNGWFLWHTWDGYKPSLEKVNCRAAAKLRHGDKLIFKNINLGNGLKNLDIRLAVNNQTKSPSERKIKFHAGGLAIAEATLNWSYSINNFVITKATILGDASSVTGIKNVSATVDAPGDDINWKESSIDWVKFNGIRIEAENATLEKVSDSHASVGSSNKDTECLSIDNHNGLVYSSKKSNNSEELFYTPLYFIFKNIWQNIPADGVSRVRKVNSYGSNYLTDSRAYPSRQSISAFSNDATGKMVVVIVNGENDSEVSLNNLTGSSADIYTYKDDLFKFDYMTEDIIPTHAVIGIGSKLQLSTPKNSISVIITSNEASSTPEYRFENIPALTPKTNYPFTVNYSGITQSRKMQIKMWEVNDQGGWDFLGASPGRKSLQGSSGNIDFNVRVDPLPTVGSDVKIKIFLFENDTGPFIDNKVTETRRIQDSSNSTPEYRFENIPALTPKTNYPFTVNYSGITQSRKMQIKMWEVNDQGGWDFLGASPGRKSLQGSSGNIDFNVRVDPLPTVGSDVKIKIFLFENDTGPFIDNKVTETRRIQDSSNSTPEYRFENIPALTPKTNYPFTVNYSGITQSRKMQIKMWEVNDQGGWDFLGASPGRKSLQGSSGNIDFNVRVDPLPTVGSDVKIKIFLFENDTGPFIDNKVTETRQIK